MHTTVFALLVVQLITVLAGPILLALWIRRRYGASWSSLGWGALTFPLSQMVRLPLLAGAAALLNPVASGWDAETLFWFNFIILTLTSGLFEEGARYIVLRWLGRSVRTWRDGVMYGAGHGGIEAILIVGATAVSNLVLLATADIILAQLQQMPAEQAAAVRAQIGVIRALTWLPIALSIWERALAIILHIGLSLLVLLGVIRRDLRLLLGAMLIHAAFNGAALLAVRYTNMVATEAILTVAALLPLALIWLLRSRLERQTASA
jgi:uncharacterized membrane protein YhfC